MPVLTADPIIRVRFIACHTIGSWTIRGACGSLFSHVEGGTKAGTWIGALVGDGVQERPADYCHPFREYVYEVPCTAEQAAKFEALLRSKIGTDYNRLAIVGLGLHLRSVNGGGDICSQLITWALIETLGAYRVLNVLADWEYRITPETLHLSPLFYGYLMSRKG